MLSKLPCPGPADIIGSGGKGSTALRISAFLFVSCLVFGLACGSGGDNDSSRETRIPQDAGAIRGLDFAVLPAAKTLLDQLGSGAIERDSVLYADLTGDRREEAIVPVTSQGTLGNIAYLVFRLASGKPEVVLTRTVDRSSAGGLQMTTKAGVLLETRGVYGPEDAFCCPSQLRETTFRWDGSRLQVASEDLVQQPPRVKN